MATNERELASLWNEVGIVEPIPCVDFRKYVVFGVAGKGGVCPDEITTAVASSGGVLKLGAEVSTSACVLVAVRAAQVVAVPRRLLGRRVVFVPFDPIETSAFAFDMTPRASDASPGEDARLADTDALGDPPPKGEVTLPAPGHLALRSFEDGTEVWIVHERSERIFAVGATFTAAPLRVPVRWNAKAGRFDPGFDWHGRSVHGEREPDITRYRVERVDPMHVRLVGRLGPPRAAAGLPEDPPTLDGPSEPYTELATSGDFASIPDGTVARLAADLVFGPVGPGRICVPPADRKLAARFAACPEEAPALDGSDGKRGGRVIVQGPLIVRRHGAGASWIIGRGDRTFGHAPRPLPAPAPHGPTRRGAELTLEASLTGDTAGASDGLSLPCVSRGGSPDEVHRFVAPTAGGYAFELTSEEDGALGVLDSSGRVLACNDDARPGRAIVHVVLERGQAIDVAVDGFGGDRGPYTLRGLRERPLEHGERLELGAPVKGDTRGALDEQRGGVRR